MVDVVSAPAAMRREDSASRSERVNGWDVIGSRAWNK